MVNLGDVFPNFEVDATGGKGTFHERIEGSWAILFSHPADYTPVCTTELGEVVRRAEDFKKRGCKLFALSCNDVDSHKGWSKDVMAYVKAKGDLPYPIIADPTPVNWTPGKECMVVPTLSEDEAKAKYPDVRVQEVPSGQRYLRFTSMAK